MPDETPDVAARARAALDAWESYVAAPDSTLMMPPPEHVLIAVIRDLLDKVEQLRDDLRVERITTHLCESVDADLREARAEVKRLRSNLNLVRRHRDAYLADRDEARAAVERVRAVAEHWRAADSWHGNAYADDVLRALDGEAARG